MYIKSINIINFKSFQDVKIILNPDLNVFTGVNNSGKTTVLEALALWQECFMLLLRLAKSGNTDTKKTNYKRGDYILGNTQEKYFTFEDLNSVRSPSFADIFYEREKQNPIKLIAIFSKDTEDIEIGFQIKSSGANYEITLLDFKEYNFEKFNLFFENFPNPVSLFYASPLAAIQQIEKFATLPNIKDALLKRESANVLRNRLYALYQSTDMMLYANYLESLNYILFNNTKKIEFFNHSDARKDTKIVFNFTTDSRDTEKDIALLGSGTLQIMEILLNLYLREQESDINLVLLDEPDSYIHRDIQKRLFNVLRTFADKNQVFITTHNESIIREAQPKHLFHLADKPQGTYTALTQAELLPVEKEKTKKSYKGIYPLNTNAIIRAINPTNGLDFINAIEADYIIFVEGEDDAQALYLLLQKAVSPQNTKKYVFWVINGINTIWKEIASYKTVFQQIKNEKTLWEKSILVIDKDFLSDEHSTKIAETLEKTLQLQTCIGTAYTFEATLLTDLPKLAKLLENWLQEKTTKKISLQDLENELVSAYKNIGENLKSKYDNQTWIGETSQRYIASRNSMRDLLTNYAKNTQNPIEQNDSALTLYYQKYLQNCLASQTYYKIAKKEDVAMILNQVLQKYGLNFSIKTDLIDLLKYADHATWFSDWNFVRRFV